MTIKLGKMIICLQQFPSVTLTERYWIKFSCKNSWQTKAIVSPLLLYQWPPNLVGSLLVLRDSYPYSHMSLWSSVLPITSDELKALYFYQHNTFVPLAIKFGRVVIYTEELPLTKLHDPPMTCFCEVTWEIKYFLYLHFHWSQCLWSPNISEWWYTVWSTHQWVSMTPQWGGHERSHKKSNTYLHLQKTHEHQAR